MSKEQEQTFSTEQLEVFKAEEQVGGDSTALQKPETSDAFRGGSNE